MSKFFIILFLFGISWVVNSQEPKWMIYPSLGIDMGGAIPLPLSSIPEDSKGTPKLTPNIGLGAQYSLNEKWNIGLDINYHVLSFTANATLISQPFYTDDRSNVLYFSGETNTNVELRFVEFPLTALYKIGENWTFTFGAYYSRILEGVFETEGKNGWYSENKEDTDNAPLPGQFSVPYNFNDELDDFDAGAILGYQYKITPRVLFWGRMHFGMKSIFIPEFQNIDYEMYQMRLSTGISYVLFKG